ncbi:MAG: methyltransferase domain-containing protein [Armatimonadetes bacterium]|nr:methyltransferase domain-containing protein [Armatimonadota bacterium]
MANGEDRIWEMARGFQSSRILLTAVELGVFPALGSGPRTSEEVAAMLRTDPRATDRLMNALVALELLVKEGNLFGNSPEAQEVLVPGGPDYMGGALMHTVNMWDSWSTLTEAVRRGTSVLVREGEARADWVVPFIAAMHYHSSRGADDIVGLIDLDGVERVLDVGGGSGVYSIAFCRAKPALRAVVFDLPDVVGLTEKYVQQAGMSGRITTASGDFHADEFGGGFDLVFLSAIIHMNSPEENIRLFKKCRRALREGGRIVVQDFIVEESRVSPPHGAIFALNMLVATPSGDTYTEAEVTAWLQAAGFAPPTRIDPPGIGTTLLIAAT